MGIETKKIGELLDEIVRGEMALPEMQREFVWKEKQVREFIDSIYRKYPAGLILLWEKPYGRDIPQIFISGRKEPDMSSVKGYRSLIIDGQQRLTSLLLVREGRVRVYFNPLTEEFQLESPRVKYDPLWFNVTDVTKKFIYEIVDRKRLKKNGLRAREIAEKVFKPLEKLREQLNTYEFPVYKVPPDTTYEQAAEIFTRINSKGTRIRTTDLLIAMFSVKAPATFRKELRELSKDLSDEDWDIDVSVLVRCIVGLAKGEGNLTNFRRSGGRINEVELMDGLNGTREYLWQLIEILKDIGIDTPYILPSGNVISPLVVYLKRKAGRISEKERKQIILWFLLSSFWGRYAGATDTRLGEDIKQVLSGSLSGLFKNLRQQVGRLKIDEESFVERSYGNEFLLYALSYNRGSLDWFKGYKIKTNFQEHHIFPRALLEDRKKPGPVDPSLFDHVGNLAFLSEKANKSIRSSEPIKYLRRIPNKRLKQQLVPIDRRLWKLENYESFLEERTSLIVKNINDWFKNLGLRSFK